MINISKIATNIEQRILFYINKELFKLLYLLEDKGAKYTNKAKSIVFNIKVNQ